MAQLISLLKCTDVIFALQPPSYQELSSRFTSVVVLVVVVLVVVVDVVVVDVVVVVVVVVVVLVVEVVLGGIVVDT